MKPDEICYICERCIVGTDERVRINKLVTHESCYLRTREFFDLRNLISRDKIEIYNDELRRIYEERTAGDYTFTGVLVSMLLDITDPPTEMQE